MRLRMNNQIAEVMNDSADCRCVENSWSAGNEKKTWKYLPSQIVSILIASKVLRLRSIVYWMAIQWIPNWRSNPAILQGVDVNSQDSERVHRWTKAANVQVPVKRKDSRRPLLPISFHITSSNQLWFTLTWQWCHYQGEYQWCHFTEQWHKLSGISLYADCYGDVMIHYNHSKLNTSNERK